jgi:alcohol dehydrogenase (cytochrome c)
VKDVAIVGTAGGEYGIRGFIDGTDLNTGKGLWRTYTIPGAGEPGNETWKDGQERWKHGGASVWETATYDPDTDTFYQGIGNAGPDYDPEYGRATIMAASVLALSPDGKIKWGSSTRRTTPTTRRNLEHPIINAKVNGEDRVEVHAAHGFYYARSRERLFVIGKQYVGELNWAPGLDPKTGRPLNYDPTKDVQIYAPGSHGLRGVPGARLCPSNSGGKNWAPSAYNAALNLMYLPTVEGCNSINTTEQKDFVDQGGTVKPRDRFAGGGTAPLRNEKRYGAIKAIDPITGEPANLACHANRAAARDRQTRT